MFRARASWVRFATQSKPVPARSFCTPTTSGSNTTKPPSNNNRSVSENNAVKSSPGNYDEAYKQLDKLDFATASKILFTDPPKRKKFGVDFHLVQLFFACMPSLAVYLVAQYARYEMRRMEAELEQKKKQDEENEKEKEKEIELSVIEGKEPASDPELLEMKVRLAKLEEAVKGIAVETKKQSISSVAKNQGNGSEERNLAITGPTDSKSGSEPSKIVEGDHLNKQDRPWFGRERVSGSAPVPDDPLQDQKGKTQN